MCSGLMCRFALLKRTLSTPGGRPHALQNQDWQKIRRQLENKFPDPGDLTKVTTAQPPLRHFSCVFVGEVAGFGIGQQSNQIIAFCAAWTCPVLNLARAAGAQIPGYDSFRASAAGMTEELRNTFELFLDLLEFKEAALALLHEIPVDMMDVKVRFGSFDSWQKIHRP